MTESLAAIIRSALDSGWRLGSLLFVGGSLFLLAHRFGFPEPRVLAEWVAWAGVSLIVGATLLLTSSMIKVFEWIGQRSTARKKKAVAAAHAEALERSIGLNISTLRPEQAGILLELLRDPRQRFEIPFNSGAYALIERHILVTKQSLSHSNSYLCELHPTVVARRDMLIEGLTRDLGTRR